MKKRFGGKYNKTYISNMETKEKNVVEAQGAKTTKKQKPSATYTLTQMTEMIKKLHELELITIEQGKTLEEIREYAKEQYIKRL